MINWQAMDTAPGDNQVVLGLCDKFTTPFFMSRAKVHTVTTTTKKRWFQRRIVESVENIYTPEWYVANFDPKENLFIVCPWDKDTRVEPEFWAPLSEMLPQTDNPEV